MLIWTSNNSLTNKESAFVKNSTGFTIIIANYVAIKFNSVLIVLKQDKYVLNVKQIQIDNLTMIILNVYAKTFITRVRLRRFVNYAMIKWTV